MSFKTIMQGQCRIQKRNWFCESGDIPASSSRPKKCKEDLKRYALTNKGHSTTTLESGIDVEQGITVGHGKFVKKNKCRALNKRRA